MSFFSDDESGPEDSKTTEKPKSQKASSGGLNIAFEDDEDELEENQNEEEINKNDVECDENSETDNVTPHKEQNEGDSDVDESSVSKPSISESESTNASTNSKPFVEYVKDSNEGQTDDATSKSRKAKANKYKKTSSGKFRVTDASDFVQHCVRKASLGEQILPFWRIFVRSPFVFFSVPETP